MKIYTASTRQHDDELDHTDEEPIALKHLDHQVGIDHTDHLSEVCKIFRSTCHTYGPCSQKSAFSFSTQVPVSRGRTVCLIKEKHQ